VKPLPPAIERRLGVDTDATLARDLGVTTPTVRRWREARGIPAALNRTRWTPEMLAALGVNTDQAIVERFGVTLNAVRLQRSRLSLRPGTKTLQLTRAAPWDRVDWSRPTSALAKLYQVHPSTITRQRKIHAPETLGVRPSKYRKQH
jgi:hypothetical protein